MYKIEYKIKDNINPRILQNFGYKYTGNYNRGEVWTKEIQIIVNNEDLGGIEVNDWKQITFKFPYIKNIKYPSIELYIQDLIIANLVEKV